MNTTWQELTMCMAEREQLKRQLRNAREHFIAMFAVAAFLCVVAIWGWVT